MSDHYTDALMDHAYQRGVRDSRIGTEPEAKSNQENAVPGTDKETPA